MIKLNDEWKNRLTSEQYNVLREKGTEIPFSGTLLHNKEKGVYKCGACGHTIFNSESKFDSGSGWPSFDKPIKKGSVKVKTDTSHGMIRKEVICPKCGSHLGHVFDDGPTKTKQRYCINSCALSFEKKKSKAKTQKAYFGAGCFWHVEEEFEKLSGVESTAVGYMGGKTQNPTYEDVCTDKTGHVEVVEVEFNPKIISYEQLLEKFFEIHDPTTKNRQGLDVGTQYASTIFYTTSEQKKDAIKSKDSLQKSGKIAGKVVTQIKPASDFYRAEEYHQKYFQKNKEKACRIM